MNAKCAVEGKIQQKVYGYTIGHTYSPPKQLVRQVGDQKFLAVVRDTVAKIARCGGPCVNQLACCAFCAVWTYNDPASKQTNCTADTASNLKQDCKSKIEKL